MQFLHGKKKKKKQKQSAKKKKKEKQKCNKPAAQLGRQQKKSGSPIYSIPFPEGASIIQGRRGGGGRGEERRKKNNALAVNVACLPPSDQMGYCYKTCGDPVPILSASRLHVSDMYIIMGNLR